MLFGRSSVAQDSSELPLPEGIQKNIGGTEYRLYTLQEDVSLTVIYGGYLKYIRNHDLIESQTLALQNAIDIGNLRIKELTQLKDELSNERKFLYSFQDKLSTTNGRQDRFMKILVGTTIFFALTTAGSLIYIAAY